MTQEKEKCIFCESDCEKLDVANHHRLDKYICIYCGEYIISQRDSVSDISSEDKFKIACVLNEYRLRDRNVPSTERMVYCISTSEKTKDTTDRIYKTTTELVEDYPQTPQEILNRSLVNLSLMVENPFDPIEFEYAVDLSVYNQNHSIRVIEELERTEHIITIRKRQPGYSFRMTAKGWEYIQKIGSKSNKVFVAMWFSDETEGIFGVIKEAAFRAGYHAERVDEIHHNDYIMDKVLNMIDESKFVITDYTTIPETANGEVFENGIRGGVYFEAGYARGKGKPVINLCRSDTSNRLHFDVSQLSQIRWEKDDLSDTSKKEALIDIITQRIIQTVGRYSK
jgi:nucleoside 2-deoxyribosyltransferase